MSRPLPHPGARPRTLRAPLLLAALTATLLGTRCASVPGRPADADADALPNVVIIFTDDQGYGDVGCFGATAFDTPRLDRMAQEGMRLTDFYVAAPVCTPSRAALLTGCYPMRVGLAHRVLFPFSKHGLNPSETTIPELLAPFGYTSACIGKWHLGHQPELMPLEQGFDRFFGVPYSNDMDGHVYQGQDTIAPPLELYDDLEVVQRGPYQQHLTRLYTDAAVSFIEENRARPFFLYVAHSMPHVPLASAPEQRGRSDYGLYGDVIEELDDSVGAILDAIDANGLREHTLVLFTSDNGPNHPGSTGGLRGRKNTTWEGGMREPCIVRWPGRVPAGSVSDEIVSAIDVLPTLAGLVGAPLPPQTIDGEDVAPILFGTPGAASPHEAFYYYKDDRLQALRSGDWKLHVFRSEWGGEEHAPLLYNLREDRAEQNDVAADHPDVVARLEVFAERARAELGDAATHRKGAGVRDPAHIAEE